ncbi:hypothetical protein J7U46_23005 [Pelomonas sp. V22]|uniref:hypothetical protein n=1 Tax=Pelomonas sp. V22 TaxID=2822139 RepID=UPI0024A81767|nr:hypothetical protein [Pelomonas sp. V22]MDI4635941.1 hypothetical protein [Pelomonas sp. V22]
MTISALARLVERHPAVFRGETPEGDLPPGWFDLANKLLVSIRLRLDQADIEKFCVVSIADDHGTLAVAFRFDGASDVFDELLSMRSAAERRSNITCQQCGRPGTKKHSNGRFRTLCTEHSTEIDMADSYNQIDPGLQRLIDAHPLLFRGQAPAISSYVSAGWYSLLDKLCTDIEAVLGPQGCVDLEVRQIKEKLGSLRFYYRQGASTDLHFDLVSPTGRQHLVGRGSKATDDDLVVKRVRELVNAACATSETVCEECGAAAELRNTGGWYTTLCHQHLAERKRTSK